MSSSQKEPPKKISAFAARRISGNRDAFHLLQSEISGQKHHVSDAVPFQKRGKGKAKLKGADRKKLYKHFSGVSSSPSCKIAKRAERIYSDLDRLVQRYSHAYENHTDHIILMGLMTLQDMLQDDRPVPMEQARDTLKILAKEYQREIHTINEMFNEEGVVQSEMITRMKAYVADRYAHLDNNEDYSTLSLVAKFSKIDPQAADDLRMYRNSKFAQEDLYAFGLFRVQQVYAVNQWMNTPECDRALELYKHLRKHKVENSGQIPLTKRLALHG